MQPSALARPFPLLWLCSAFASCAAGLRPPVFLENAEPCLPSNMTRTGYLHGRWAVQTSDRVTYRENAQLLAKCSCRRGVLEANFTWRSNEEYDSFRHYVGVLESGGAIGPVSPANGSAWLDSVDCVDADEAADLCEASNLDNAFCPEIVWVQREIVMLNNITQTVTEQPSNTSDTTNVMQREIDSFLSSFDNATNYFYGSNVGIGNNANVMLWAAFLMFCLVSVILQWMSARRRRAKIALLLLTINSSVMMLGYLTMAFGHGRTTEEQAIFRWEIIEAAFMFNGEIVQTPIVPPLFFARYVMWFFSAPTVLFLTCDFAMARRNVTSTWVLDSVMILALLCSAQLQQDSMPEQGWFCYCVAALCYAALVVLLVGPVLNSAKAHERLEGYTRIMVFVLASWALYLLTSLLGNKGTAALHTDVEVIMFVCLDVLFVMGFTVILLNEHRMLAKHGEQALEPVVSSPQLQATPAPPLGRTTSGAEGPILSKTESRLAVIRRRVAAAGSFTARSPSLSPGTGPAPSESRVDVERVQSLRPLAGASALGGGGEEAEAALTFTSSPEIQTAHQILHYGV